VRCTSICAREAAIEQIGKPGSDCEMWGEIDLSARNKTIGEQIRFCYTYLMFSGVEPKMAQGRKCARLRKPLQH
jgi:hypothetical protein